MRMNTKFCFENIVQISHLGQEKVTWRMYSREVGQYDPSSKESYRLCIRLRECKAAKVQQRTVGRWIDR
jgi:hypothetical protein